MFYLHLENVLTPKRCLELLETSNTHTFEAAAINNGGTQELSTNIRNNDKVEFDDLYLAKTLEQVLKDVTGVNFPFSIHNQNYSHLSSFFRVYRYIPGQYFRPHKDNSYELGNLASQVTALFYLNDTDGGETVLMPYGAGQTWAHKLFQPKAGDVLLFDHNILHEGKPVRSGEKFVLRTDLFYENSNASC